MMWEGEEAVNMPEIGARNKVMFSILLSLVLAASQGWECPRRRGY